jgi:hypothetical protein
VISVRFPGRPAAIQEHFEVIYAAPETVRFLAAVRRLKEQRQRKVRRTRQAKQRVRAVLRQIRAF